MIHSRLSLLKACIIYVVYLCIKANYVTLDLQIKHTPFATKLPSLNNVYSFYYSIKSNL